MNSSHIWCIANNTRLVTTYVQVQQCQQVPARLLSLNITHKSQHNSQSYKLISIAVLGKEVATHGVYILRNRFEFPAHCRHRSRNKCHCQLTTREALTSLRW